MTEKECMIHRRADYEDTGLEPQEIHALADASRHSKEVSSCDQT